MNEHEFDKLIKSLDQKIPLRIVRSPNKIVWSEKRQCFHNENTKQLDSLQWKSPEHNGEWVHLMSIPKGKIYKTRNDNYKVRSGVPHRSLMGVYKKLVSSKAILASNKHKFL